MKTEFNFINLAENSDFTIDEIEPLKQFILNRLNERQRVPGTGFLYKGITFTLASIGYDVDRETQILIIQQVTTAKKSVIEKPELKIIPQFKN